MTGPPRTVPQPYAVVVFAGGHVRFVREGKRLLLQIDEIDGAAEARLTDEQRLQMIDALIAGAPLS